MNDLIYLISSSSPNTRNPHLILGHFNKSSVSIIEKSYALDAISNNVTIEKTGKEIKEALDTVEDSLKGERDKHYQNMLAYKNVAKVDPIGDMEYYDLNGFENRLSDIPKQYSYEQRYPNSKEESESPNLVYSNHKVESITDEQKKAMYEYNRCAEKYIRTCINLLVIETLEKNLSDSKKISLSPRQAALLGF